MHNMNGGVGGWRGGGGYQKRETLTNLVYFISFFIGGIGIAPYFTESASVPELST